MEWHIRGAFDRVALSSLRVYLLKIRRNVNYQINETVRLRFLWDPLQTPICGLDGFVPFLTPGITSEPAGYSTQAPYCALPFQKSGFATVKYKKGCMKKQPQHTPQTCIIMVALCNRGDHYIFAL